MPSPGMYVHKSRGMEIIDTWPSLGHSTTTSIVSVRNVPPGRLSDPISMKLRLSPPDSWGTGGGASASLDATGGAAAVGNSEFRSTVGSVPTDGVPAAKNGSSVGTWMKYRDGGAACPECGG